MNAPPYDHIVNLLTGQLAKVLSLPPETIDVTSRYHRLGLTSKRAVGFLAAVGNELGRKLPATLVWDYPTIAETAAFLAEINKPADSTKALQIKKSINEPIAVVGLACRFPGAENPKAFWELLKAGRNMSRVVKERYDWQSMYDEHANTPGKLGTKYACLLEDVYGFDPEFFGISEEEALQMDPQQRLVCELAWEVVADTGYRPSTLAGSATGVFVSAMWSDYYLLTGRLGREHINKYTATGHHLSIIANRVSYLLDLTGPSITIDTASSSSLVAVHLACQSILQGECDLALAGGVNLILAADGTVALTKFGAMAPDGQSKAFDAAANGYVRGEGAALVALKRLSKAEADGDRIYCTIEGGAWNNDGASNGMTAPNPAAQRAVLKTAYAQAGINPADVDYVETHGPGTVVGDPIEAGALHAVLGNNRQKTLKIGSVKTNIGHQEAAAGIAGFTKLALSLYHKAWPATLNFKKANPNIPFDDYGMEVVTNFEAGTNSSEYIAGINSFGFGGVNCHLVLKSTPKKMPAPVIITKADSMIPKPEVVFVFSGQGSQHRGMAVDLLGEPIFRRYLDQCQAEFAALSGQSIIDLLLDWPDEEQVEIVQPVLFSIQYALAKQWIHRGVIPDVVVGHSMGEVAAAAIAGKLSLKDAMQVVWHRSRLLKKSAGLGAMALVGLSEQRLADYIYPFRDTLSIAAVNSPNSLVVSGEKSAVELFVKQFEGSDVFVRPIKVVNAGHCALLDPVKPELFTALQNIEAKPGQISFLSTVFPHDSDCHLDASYWVNNLREPVHFAARIENIMAGTKSGLSFIEISPHPILSEILPEMENYRAGFTHVPSLRRKEKAGEIYAASAEKLINSGLGFHPINSPVTTATDFEVTEFNLPVSGHNEKALEAKLTEITTTTSNTGLEELLQIRQHLYHYTDHYQYRGLVSVRPGHPAEVIARNHVSTPNQSKLFLDAEAHVSEELIEKDRRLFPLLAAGLATGSAKYYRGCLRRLLPERMFTENPEGATFISAKPLKDKTPSFNHGIDRLAAQLWLLGYDVDFFGLYLGCSKPLPIHGNHAWQKKEFNLPKSFAKASNDRPRPQNERIIKVAASEMEIREFSQEPGSGLVMLLKACSLLKKDTAWQVKHVDCNYQEISGELQLQSTPNGSIGLYNKEAGDYLKVAAAAFTEPKPPAVLSAPQAGQSKPAPAWAIEAATWTASRAYVKVQPDTDPFRAICRLLSDWFSDFHVLPETITAATLYCDGKWQPADLITIDISVTIAGIQCYAVTDSNLLFMGGLLSAGEKPSGDPLTELVEAAGNLTADDTRLLLQELRGGSG